jgi:hypothetical protein
MMAEEALIGMRVRVQADYRLAHLRGKEGRIINRWGSSNHVAVVVLLDDDRSELFWPHQLEGIEDEGYPTKGRPLEPADW